MGGGGSKPPAGDEEDARRKHKHKKGRPSSQGSLSSQQGGGRHNKYGSFAEDHAPFIWEGQTGPWHLFLLSVVAMLKNVAGLLMLYWVLVSQKQYLMKCDSRKHSMAVVVSCEYTKAFLRGFPLLAASITLVVAKRVLLQQRVYYGLLKLGGLLDFKNTNGLRDPMVWLLAISLWHGLCHFVLKVYFEHEIIWHADTLAELGVIGQKFFVPSFIFMAFFYMSYDVEKTLIPLSKYFEEDSDYAKRTLSSMHHLKEDIVREEIMATDLISCAAAPHIKDVYKALITRYHRAAHGFDEKGHRICGCELRLFHSMWPAHILLDSRLQDNDSISFRRMFIVFVCLASIIQVIILAGFGYQVYHDIWIDVYTQGETEDLGSFFVMFVHLIIIFGVMLVSIYSGFPNVFTCCGKRAKPQNSGH